MRVAVGQFHELSDERLRFAAQLGASGVLLNTPTLPGTQHWEYADLHWLRTRCEQYGLRLEALENVPVGFYDQVMLGLPGRDEQIEHYQTTIRNMGRAGISILGYHWMPNGVWRTSYATRGRGGALVSSFEAAQTDSAFLTHGRVYSEEEMWENYRYFIKAVLPVAEGAGVTLALHPDDPPVPALGGVARLFRGFEGFNRAMEMAPSRYHGLDFCMGCWSEMGVDVITALRHFGSRGQLAYIHFRDVQGTAHSFQECFLGEGNVDVSAAIRTLYEVGFDSFIIDDHVPRLVDDTEWAHRGRAFQTGYIMGLVRALQPI